MDKGKSLILGGSQGLGLSLKTKLNAQSMSRTEEHRVDLSKPNSLDQVKNFLEKRDPFETIIYCAGGGPHGDFFSKSPQAHKWAFEVNYFRPIDLAYYLRSIHFTGFFIYIGSAIAERSNSLKSLSYSQSKKAALKALLTLKEEELKVRVFSPPYMNTRLLPPKAWPRVEEQRHHVSHHTPHDTPHDTPHHTSHHTSDVAPAPDAAPDAAPDRASHLVLEPHQVADVLLSWIRGDLSQSGSSDPRHFDWMDRFLYSLPEGKEF